MNRKASCSCGQLTVDVSGDPKRVLACNCLQCQKRTGSVLGVSSYFANDKIVSISGESNTYERSSDSGRKIQSNFCPECGTTVFWKAEVFPELTGVAVGCFTDSNFPEPQAIAWTSTKHDWVSYPDDLPSSRTQEFGK